MSLVIATTCLPICYDDIEIPDNRGVFIVSETELCGSSYQETAGDGSGDSNDSVGHFLHFVSILQSHGVNTDAGMG